MGRRSPSVRGFPVPTDMVEARDPRSHALEASRGNAAKLAMHKVVGSGPITRFTEIPANAGFFAKSNRCRGARIIRLQAEVQAFTEPSQRRVRGSVSSVVSFAARNVAAAASLAAKLFSASQPPSTVSATPFT